MKTLLILFSILLLISECKNKTQTEVKIMKPASVKIDSLKTKIENTKGNRIVYDNMKVIKNIYIVDRNGTPFKQEARNNAKTLGYYKYGDKLEVIEVTEQWWGVRERITREYIENGNQIESTAWEKVFVLKSNTGPLNKITLKPSDLYTTLSVNLHQKNKDLDNRKKLTDYLKIELIDKKAYYNAKKNVVNFLIVDSTKIKKNKNMLILHCQDTIVTFQDKPNKKDNIQNFFFIGQIKFLNQFIIKGVYWEGVDYKFIDVITGKETKTFGEYPYISKDKKSIISIYSNIYESTADLELYTIKNNKIHDIMSVSFSNWTASDKAGEMFWSKDGYLYLPVNHVKSYWTEDGAKNKERQYIKITVL